MVKLIIPRGNIMKIYKYSVGVMGTNAYIILDEETKKAALVDPGDESEKLMNAIESKNAELSYIILTHGHFDHMLSAQPLSRITGAPTYVHPLEEEMLCDAEKNAYNAMAASQPCPVDFEPELLEETIEIEGMKFEVMHTPGHTKGSVCFYDAENGVLFSGDTLFCAGFGRMDLYGGSPVQMRSSLRKLFSLPGNTRVLCGHGYETTIGMERGRYNL
jgi:glyoxylase-like metal-dependent hydrolase (beta-lactamase superfamily II)